MGSLSIAICCDAPNRVFIDDVVSVTISYGYIPERKLDGFHESIRDGLGRISAPLGWKEIIGIHQDEKRSLVPSIYDEIVEHSWNSAASRESKRESDKEFLFVRFLESLHVLMVRHCVSRIDLIFVIDRWTDYGSIRADRGNIKDLSARLSHVGHVGTLMYNLQTKSYYTDVEVPLLYTLDILKGDSYLRD